MAEFDDIAKIYDSDFTYSKIGKMQRNIVWDFFQQHYKRNPKEDVRLLEMNCGTGEDALFFAKQGIFVTATDISEEMLNVVKNKTQSTDFQENISIQKWDLSKPFSPESNISTTYNIAFSNFGGWNCLNANEITQLSENLAAILPSKAQLFVVIMPRFCVWESLYFLYKRNWNAIFRRLSHKAIPAKLENVYVNTYYYSPTQIKKLLSPHFKALDYQAVGFFIPPSYLEKFFQKKPSFLPFLHKLEKFIQKLRYAAFASDHFIMVLERKNPFRNK